MATKSTAEAWGKTLDDMDAGTRNPRILVVELNRHMKRTLAWLGRKWGVSMITYDVINGNAKWRPRRPDEMPENDPQQWIKTAEYARAVALSAKLLAEFADRQAAAAVARRREGS